MLTWEWPICRKDTNNPKQIQEKNVTKQLSEKNSYKENTLLFIIEHNYKIWYTHVGVNKDVDIVIPSILHNEP